MIKIIALLIMVAAVQLDAEWTEKETWLMKSEAEWLQNMIEEGLIETDTEPAEENLQEFQERIPDPDLRPLPQTDGDPDGP